MKYLIGKISNLFGIDKAVFYTILSRLLQAIGGIITLLLIASFLNEEEQGYYYTFASVLVIQIFFELGLGGILTQFVAHEMSFLQIKDKSNIIGKEKNLSRLSSIIRFSLKWYIIFSLVFTIALIVFGSIFFKANTQENVNIIWRNPWILASIFAGLNLFISPVSAILQGMYKVKEMAKVTLIQQSLVMLFAWSSLVLGAKLYVVAINLLIGCLVLIVFYLCSPNGQLLYNIFKYKQGEGINYWQEIFPFQWKIALSWMSGYFIFQAFNPIVFMFYGPVVAGQVGMTLTILNAMLSLVVAWTSTKIPFWSSMIAKKEYNSLEISLRETIKKSTLISIIAILIACTGIEVSKLLGLHIAYRFLPLDLCFVLFMTIPANNIINSWATSLRCFKKEPFLKQAVLVGCLTLTQLYLFATYFDVKYLIIGYSSIVYFISFPLSYYIFKNKKKQYYV